MPLTKAGKRTLRRFEREYPGRGKSVFYATLRSHPELEHLERRRNPDMRGWIPYLLAGGALYWWVQRSRQTIASQPQPQNPTRLAQTPQLPTSTLNATYPSDTQLAFAAFPRSVVLQGPVA